MKGNLFFIQLEKFYQSTIIRIDIEKSSGYIVKEEENYEYRY